ncbi:hypothetical protein KKI24_18945 [bacterium]|nr:hypothetical protein [bacterium]
MKQNGILKKVFFCLFLCSLLVTNPSYAKQEKLLAELTPDKTALGVFNSFKYKILLVSLVQTDKPAFNCLPNQYLLYNYGSEEYHEIDAGNLKISSDYTYIFRTRIHSLAGFQPANKMEEKRVLQMLSKTLKIPQDLILAARLTGKNPNLVCWQQPELITIHNQPLRTFPFLMANLCDNEWCSELYWTGPRNIQFWIHEKPPYFQLVNLDVEKSTITIKTQSTKFVRPHIPQLNAPRENLFNSKTLPEKTLILKKTKHGSVSLVWRKIKTGRIQVLLTRDGSDQTAAQRIAQGFSRQIMDKELRKALQSADFGLWLDPGNQDLKIGRLIAFISLSRLSEFYTSLESDFSAVDRFSACQKLHLEPSIRHLWQNEAFAQRFKKICSP